MIWTQEDVDDFMKGVLPPNFVLKKKGFCGGQTFTFINALSIAIDPKMGSELLIEALQKKYPEAVESHLQKAKDLLKESGKKKRL